MKNTNRSKIVGLFNTIFNVRVWFDWERIKAFTLYLVEGFKKFFVPQQRKAGETFEAAKKRLKLTEKDLLARQTGLLRLSILMVVFAILTFGYSVYLFTEGGHKGGIVGLVLMLIALVLAFRYHFWYFQIKERKLGCTIQEWFNHGLKGGK